MTLPPRSPNLNAFAERWVRSVKEECLSKLILCGEVSLQRALNEFIAHFHKERNHQGKENRLLFPAAALEATRSGGRVRYHERLDGCRAVLKSWNFNKRPALMDSQISARSTRASGWKSYPLMNRAGSAARQRFFHGSSASTSSPGMGFTLPLFRSS